MNRRLALAGASILAILVSLIVYPPPAHAAVGIRISNGRLVEANGTELVLRGINHPHTWFKTQTSSFAAIKAAGANSVRVVLSGGRWQPADTASQVVDVINLCKQNRLICVLENHDTTGFGEQGGSVSLDAAVNYWISIQSALTGQENYVILNIGNEPFGNNAVTPNWTQATSAAITRLRNAGFQHTIMVDAPNWGQDWQFQMRDNAPTVRAADPSGNTIFSVHMYGVFDTAAEINAYVNSFVSRGIPLVIGEFGFNHSDGNPDEDTIMATAQANRIGHMGWSWSGNGCCVEYLDMVLNFNPANRSTWGTRYIAGPNGLQATSREATIYSGGCSDTTAPSTPGAPTVSGITSTGATLSWGASTDTGCSGLAGYTVFREQGATDPQLAASATNSTPLTGLTPNTQYQVYVRARDNAGNQSANSTLVTFTTSAGGGGGGSCRVAYSIGAWGGSPGFTASLTLTNTGTTAINGWTLTYTMPSGQQLTPPGWSANWTQTGATMTVTPLSWNTNLPPGQGTSIGFNGTHTGNTSTPTAFTLNGGACTLG